MSQGGACVCVCVRISEDLSGAGCFIPFYNLLELNDALITCLG